MIEVLVRLLHRLNRLHPILHFEPAFDERPWEARVDPSEEPHKQALEVQQVARREKEPVEEKVR